MKLVLLRFLLVGLVVAVLGSPSAQAMVERRTDFTKLDTKVTMSDGTQIAVTFFEPAGTPPPGGWPAVMFFHGLGQTRNSLDLNTWSANRVAETYLVPNGYAALTFDARAHGESGGLFSLDGPRELEDTKTLFEWLTSHPEIDKQHVGAFGVSYGGGMVLRATASHAVPFAVIAVAATWTDLSDAILPQGLIRAGIVAGFSLDVPQTRWTPELASVLRAAISEQDTPEVRAFLAERSSRSLLSDVHVPVFYLQGRRDFAFDADQALTAFRALKGPKRLYLGDLGHAPAPNPVAEVNHFATEIRSWYDRFLKGADNGMGNRPQVELAPDPWGSSPATYNGLPPTRALRFKTRGSATLTATGKVVRTLPRVKHIETLGTPIVRATISSRTGYKHLVVVLSAIPPQGPEIVITDGGIELSNLTGKPRVVTIRLPDEITSIPARSRLRLTLAATSTAQDIANIVYLLPVPNGSVAKIGRVTLTLPVLKKPVSP